MKKHRSKHTPKATYQIVDIKKEIPEKQLATLGAMALAFNEAEAALDRLFFTVTDLTDALQLEVSTRIGGLDGKVEIVKKGAAQFFTDTELLHLQELLGAGVFGNLKDYRDGVIHARHLNPATGVGTKVDRRAQVFDYLVKENALNAAYDLLVAVRKELDESVILVQGIKALNVLAGDDPNREQLEAKLKASRSQFQLYQSERLGLPPLPEFPSELELRKADFLANTAQTAILMSWFLDQPFQMRQYHRNVAFLDSPPAWVPRPPPEEEKK